MKFSNPFRREKRELSLEEVLIQGGILTKQVTKDQALNIPVFAACVELISSTVAALPICLYKTDELTTETVEDDREDLLNGDTGDTLDGFQMKKAVIEDYLLSGGGYIYINRSRNTVKSLNYVEHSYVSFNYNFDPIFKKGEILVFGQTFRDFEFIKLLRRTRDGFTGKGIIKENNDMLSIAYNQIKYENALLATGGSKKGFLKAQGRLSKEALEELKKGWRDLYSQNSENVLVLNNGIDFQEASLTSVELQMNENKITNSDQICKMFLVPPSLLSGTANNEEYQNWIKLCITPILTAFETALNKELLLPSEQENYHFAFDTGELMKADIETRFKAYEIGIKNAIYQIDEVRFKESLPPLDLKFLKMGLQDVLYFPATQEIYTPNTNAKYDINEATESPEEQALEGEANEGAGGDGPIDANKAQTQPNQPNQANQPNKGGVNGENVQPNSGPNQKDKQSTDNNKKG